MILKPVVWIVGKKEVKNFTWPEANHLAIYERDIVLYCIVSCTQDYQEELQVALFALLLLLLCLGRGLKSGHADFNSNTLTNRPRCLRMRQHVTSSKVFFFFFETTFLWTWPLSDRKIPFYVYVQPFILPSRI